MNNENKKNERMCFDTIGGATLMSTPLQPLRFVVDSLISQGLHVLAGSPKVGKSWLALWLSVTVAKGEPVWGMRTRQGTTLYLCLEDSRLRIQNRLFEIMEDAPPSVHFCTDAFIIGDGLDERIETFIDEHPDTVFIIIDTLQMVRGSGYDNTYANDYRDLSVLKKLADRHGVAILLIHHLRKEGADDVFNRISGTTGVQGAVDSSFTLIEDKRGSGKAKLSCIGRDIEYREICLERNEDNVWEKVSDSREQPELLSDAIISLLSAFMKTASHFIGTPTELADRLFSQSGDKISPKKISQRILQNTDALMDSGITFDIRRSNGKRLIELTRADGDDSADKTGTTPDTPNIVPIDTVCGGLDTEALPLGEASKASGYTPVAVSGALPHTPVTKGA